MPSQCQPPIITEKLVRVQSRHPPPVCYPPPQPLCCPPQQPLCCPPQQPVCCPPQQPVCFPPPPQCYAPAPICYAPAPLPPTCDPCTNYQSYAGPFNNYPSNPYLSNNYQSYQDPYNMPYQNNIIPPNCC
jgi:hypothetical protein